MSARFAISTTPLPGLVELKTNPRGDARGYFERLYCIEELGPYVPATGIKQINRTLTRTRGTVRGMHFQFPPHAETKLILCLRGEVFDVAVDLRRDSPGYLHWHATVLSATNNRMVVIPTGCAHGFQTLTEECELLYFHTADYHPAAEGGINPCDPSIAIAWPLPVVGLSERDAALPEVADAVARPDP
jgi:dTDP-4-dehydrorhamnose 3,5-epimerase